MFSKFIKFSILTTALAASSHAIAASGGDRQSNTSKKPQHELPADIKDGEEFLEMQLFRDIECKVHAVPKPAQPVDGKEFLPVALLIDVGLAIVGDLLEKQKDGLMATYAENKTEYIPTGLKCIKIERKKKNDRGKDKSLMRAKIAVEAVNVNSKASRFVLKELLVGEPAPSRSKVKEKTKLNFAFTIGVITVDGTGKERAFSRNLPLIQNVPLSGSLSGLTLPDVEVSSNDRDRIIASSAFADLPIDMTATITVSVTETDSRFSKAEKLSDFFESNMSIIDTALGEVFD